MSAIAPELSDLFNSGRNLRQKPSNLGLCELNDPQQEELVQDADNVERSNRRYGKSQIREALDDRPEKATEFCPSVRR